MSLDRAAAGAAMLLAVALFLPVPARADSCVDLCGAACVKPISIADRWDDASGIPGYMGELVGSQRRPDWRSNGQLNRESFGDTNGNGLFDAGESWSDSNGNGTYDQELYDPALTGYVTPGDIGLVLTLHIVSDPFAVPTPGLYWSIDLPPVNKGTPITGSSAYRSNFAGCNPVVVEPGDRLQFTAGLMTGPTNQAMHDLMAQDPNAAWNPATQGIAGSAFPLSPRVLFFAVLDPRFPGGSPSSVTVTKVVAFFMEQMTGTAEVQGRLLRTLAPAEAAGPACTAGQIGGFLVTCPVPAASASWGQVKATYR